MTFKALEEPLVPGSVICLVVEKFERSSIRAARDGAEICPCMDLCHAVQHSASCSIAEE
jgi:hypothetical protein